MKDSSTWHSDRIKQTVRLVRWGHFGTPVLLFPTAGGDAEEVERFHLIGAIWHLVEAGRIKVYSLDSVAGRAWVSKKHSPEYCSWMQNQFDSCIYNEVAPAIFTDCSTSSIEIITAGASIGAFNAVATVCRHPDVFKLAIGMSGTYDLSGYLYGSMNQDFYFSSPLHYLPGLDGSPQLEALRRRFILMPTGTGDWEEPGESWRMAHVLGAKAIPNRVDAWGQEWKHDWPTWRAMLPQYLDQFA